LINDPHVFDAFAETKERSSALISQASDHDVSDPMLEIKALAKIDRFTMP
jgi:hypothetical protein